MDKNELDKLIDNLYLDEIIELDEIPELDLYMDQVIQLFENKYNKTLRTEEDKVLTKTMINNYAKDKIFMPIKNKKYSKEHLILISLIYELKGSLSISDIKKVLTPIVSTLNNNEEYDIRSLYRDYTEVYGEDVNLFKESAADRLKYIEDKLKIEKGILDGFNRKLILLSSLVNMSNFYRRLAEKVVDDINSSDK
ncbi:MULTISPECIES: DUF1836 domain-containing protein [Clostridium]|jgi:hypothetical protein|uniref:DUF1836 domain-containing protein n=2 Tax=Clostridium intestinale TaxID=36845 RepID=A0A7D6VZP7_9CLOT|nr:MULTISPECIES: DUF1836 domain-containing protein [Clostridium]QLY79491.1 DUF1836 domain-containing protein [Clostridium intestinale]SHI27812.1 protein of unknown function [Clostridium intestinale DSM 6191]